jgi:hypothetical protein
MKVYIGPYTHWFGPHQLAEKLCFWVKDVKDEDGFKSKPRWVHNFGECLAHGSVEPESQVGDITFIDRDRHNTWLYKLLLWIESKKQRKIQVRIDRWDTWSMDDTLAHIILPMLKQLKQGKQGAPYVDNEDVPEHIRSTAARELTQEEKDWGAIDEYHFARWDWVLDEMIFAFNSVLDDSWEDQFHSGEGSLAVKKLENGNSELISTGNRKYDVEGRKAYQARITNGFKLFGKYYQSLWT